MNIKPEKFELKYSISKKINSSLEQRISEQSDYSDDEIVKVTNLDNKLIPQGIELDLILNQKLRSLASLSRCELRSPAEIKSHRKFIGPVIVFFKRLSWPLIKVHLEKTFKGQQEFNGLMIEALVEQIIANKK